MTVDDKFRLSFTVLPAANLNRHDYVTCFYSFSFPNCLNVIYRFFKVKYDIFWIT